MSGLALGLTSLASGRAAGARIRVRPAGVACGLALICGVGLAQELEPGLYQNVPIGLNVAAVGYTFSTGNILFDSSVPIEGATAVVHTVGLGYVRTLALFGKTAKLDAQLPISSAKFEGFVEGEFRTRSPSGLADPRVRLTVNLLGAPALAPREFAGYRQGTVLGVSFQMAVPLGQYDPARLINLGSNRWSFRPELGLSHAQGRWFLEAAAGGWFFTENTDYFGGRTLTQDPLYFAKTQVIYTFKRGLWLSLSYGWAKGGETRVEGVVSNTLQTNTRVGATLSLPAGRASSLKLVYTSGLTTRVGADFDSYGVTYQLTWAGASRR
ncbi:MAG: transporter [Thermoanaerobaculia bacterium]